MVKRFTKGYPIVGPLAEPGVPPNQNCADPELNPQHLLSNSERRTKDRRADVADPDRGALREDALDQVNRGWLDGPFPFDEYRKLVTGGGPQLANPASRFGAQQSKKLRSVDDPERSQTKGAAAVRAPVNPPTRYFGKSSDT